MTIPYEAFGKQVTLAGQHICDAASNDLADLIAASLNVPEYLDAMAMRQKSTGVRMALQVSAQNIRTGLHVPDAVQS